MTARRLLLLAIAAAPAPGCWRTVTDAPPGTPPLVIKLPAGPFVITEPVPIEATWEAGCVKTFYMLQDRTAGDEELDLHIDKTTEHVACKAQRFTAAASCVPGPCTVYTGSRGKSRTLSVVFGAPGTHDMTLTIDNGKIRKAWTTDIEVVAADAIKLRCVARENHVAVRCDQRRPQGVSFEITAEVYAKGHKVEHARPLLAVNGRELKDSSLTPPPGTHVVTATYDGVHAELWLVVEPGPPAGGSPSPLP